MTDLAYSNVRHFVPILSHIALIRPAITKRLVPRTKAVYFDHEISQFRGNLNYNADLIKIMHFLNQDVTKLR